MLFSKYFILLNFSVILCVVLGLCTAIDVKTSSGVVRGQTLTAFNQTVNQFLGIPYALPPIGKLRFAKPEPITTPSKDIIDATKTKNSCIQPKSEMFDKVIGDLTQSEDCLFLNIWTTNDSKNSSLLKPVMFWIHGGSFAVGSIFQTSPYRFFYNGTALAAQDVVLVSVNYRLGYFGFLYGGDESAPGNVGLYDQNLALKWVRNNIHMFGGDKDMVTIFGESAGSGSVSAHILSPLSKGLFKRAILESGAALYTKENLALNKVLALEKAIELAKSLNCFINELECLRALDVSAFEKSLAGSISPTVDTEFLPYTAQQAFTFGQYNKDIDIIAGNTRDEAAEFASQMIKLTLTKLEYEIIVNTLLTTTENIHATTPVDLFYFGSIPDTDKEALKWAFYAFLSDITLICPTYLFAKQYATLEMNSNVYYYAWNYASANLDALIGCDATTMGICHAADIEFVFGLPLLYPDFYPKVNMDFSADVVRQWTNFAKTGNPDHYWPNLIAGTDVTKVKDMNPNNKNHIIDNLLKKTCDDFWKFYFL